jgi:hypothetical protein
MELYHQRDWMKYSTLLYLALFCCALNTSVYGQNKLEIDGQASVIGSYSPDNSLDMLLAARYIPELNYKHMVDSNTFLDIEASVNIFGSVSSLPFDTAITATKLSPYRMWVRYTGEQFEIRAGLQKIDFGSATLLRPLQWFNEIDPRDPLQLTNGVYGLLGKYYFLNNANIWVWGLYGNEKTRGFDAIKTNKEIPEFGGRIQYPTGQGEFALSYHHRKADASELFTASGLDEIDENRFALDGKWDVTVGLWFELTHIEKSKDIGILTRQTMGNIGVDYTFGLGNGLTVIAEHLSIAYNQNAINVDNLGNITATTLSYPLGLFDNLTSIVYYNWSEKDVAYFLNYQHQFNKITGYVMTYLNPSTQQGIRQNEFVNNFSGPGVMLMCVYNH